MKAKPAPPSRAQWRIDSEMRGGHSPGEVIAYLDWCDDYADEQTERRRAVPFGAVPAAAEPRGWLRRLFGR